MGKYSRPCFANCGLRKKLHVVAAVALATIAMPALSNPVVQVGNFVASNQSGQSGSTPTFIIYVSDMAANPVAEDIEGMDFTVQLGTGTGSLPAISNVDLTTNTVWTGNVNGPFGGIDPASGNGAQWQSYAVTTSFDTNTNTGTVINPNGALAKITLNAAGASAGTIAFKMIGTKDPTRDSAFSDGLGNTVPSSITNGMLTIVNNPVVYWTGASSNAWDTTNNWSSAAAPTAAQDAYFANHIPASGATINLTSVPETVNNLWFDGSYTYNGGKINLGGGKVTVFAGSNVSINSEIDGAAGLTFSGGGNLTLGGSASSGYTGDTNVNAGTLTLAKSGGAIAMPGGNLNVNSATVQFNAPFQTGSQIAVTLTNGASTATMAMAAGASQTVGSVSGNGTIAFPATLGPSLAIGNSTTDNVFAGAITGAGNLIKRNNNTLTLSGSSLSIAAVTVNAGTLTFSSVAPNLSGTSLSGSWTVNAGTLNLPAGSTVTTIAPTGSVTLGAQTASFPALNSLDSNQGTFNVFGGLGALTPFTTAGDLTNDGTVTVRDGNLTVSGGLKNTGTAGTSGTTGLIGGTISASYIRQSSLGFVSGTASIKPQASGGGTSVLGALAFGGTASAPVGKLDIADNKLIVNDSSGNHANTAAAINTEVNAAADFNVVSGKPRWDANGITSSSLVPGGILDPAHSIGVADNATLGTAARTTFGGQAVTASSILVGYTLSGDANMDGKVTFADFQSFLSHYGQTGTWQQGDFNHDGKVTFSDFQLLLSDYGQSMPGAGAAFITPEQYAAVEDFAQSVPEPGSLGVLLAAAAVGLLKRSRRCLWVRESEFDEGKKCNA